jgi:hypothetical protein
MLQARTHIVGNPSSSKAKGLLKEQARENNLKRKTEKEITKRLSSPSLVLSDKMWVALDEAHTL